MELSLSCIVNVLTPVSYSLSPPCVESEQSVATQPVDGSEADADGEQRRTQQARDGQRGPGPRSGPAGRH